MTPLKDISDSLAAAVEAAAGSVVEVRARRGKSATGIAWDKDHVLTSSHAIESEDEIIVVHDETSVPATVVGRDAGSDLAFIKAARHGATPATRGSGTSLRPGELVLAVGRPGAVQGNFGAVGSTNSLR